MPAILASRMTIAPEEKLPGKSFAGVAGNANNNGKLINKNKAARIKIWLYLVYKRMFFIFFRTGISYGSDKFLYRISHILSRKV
jgi:hypothetical protein